MPRLLLVDDNPSIHRIAESLLAPTDVELVCVESAEEALDRLGRGDRYDVILVDTAMPGMDGWTLLARLREMKETAHLPIALMAGVLDPVDPAKLAKAPVQGFLKKPIELRELGDRVKALLATPVHVSVEPSPFTTIPATPAKDMVRMAEAALPEYRPEAAAPPPPAEPAPVEVEEDLLVLTAEDLWPEEAAVAAPPELEAAAEPEVRLELEELDLESLQELAPEALPVADPLVLAPLALDLPPTVATGAHDIEVLDESLLTLPSLEAFDGLPGGLDLPPLPAHPEPLPPAAAIVVAEPLAEPAPAPEPAGLSMADLGLAAPTLAAPVLAAAALEPAAAPAPAAPGQADVAPGQSLLSPEQIQALLADPALMDALVKAVVARMGDQVVREIAWEVMPDLAGRLQR